jgi:pimeloyl-ACP methyl ester carboxylesterase
MAVTNAEFLRTHLRNATIVRFDDGIHDLELQKPEDVAALVLEFLAQNGMNGKSASNPNDQNPSSQ